ncbi:response regulator [Paractinoplanes globisporus]|uniref:Response regulator n=1 Tax=Paractinoplanes globisporus TaxID=113565 RepID=A0ABW6W817_9ACTN|nr:response regulator [Actinoplanes globisporus]
MRMILSRIVASLGFETAEADNGRTGLEALGDMAVPPDLVLVDWNMPEVGGLEFVAAVRSRPDWRDISIIMVSTEGERTRIARALAAGAHEYVIKPFTRDAIEDKLSLLGLTGAGVSPLPGGR